MEQQSHNQIEASVPHDIGLQTQTIVDEYSEYYKKRVIHFYQAHIPVGSSVLHINCHDGFLLHALQPLLAVGIRGVDSATWHQNGYFMYDQLEVVPSGMTFEYVIVSQETMYVPDVQLFLEQLSGYITPHSRIMIDVYAGSKKIAHTFSRASQKLRHTPVNWFSKEDMINIAYLAGYEIVRTTSYLLVSRYMKIISWFCNKLLSHMPFFSMLNQQRVYIFRPFPRAINAAQTSVTVVIPCRNESGNIERAITSLPKMGSHTQIIFVEGNSTDDTYDRIRMVQENNSDKDILVLVQDGIGKGDAVRKGFAHATGDILMILDADLTVDPSDLPKFFDALVTGRGEFINGSRLVYGMESGAMQFLNSIANAGFGYLFSWLLGQRVKDTLCGTKVLWKYDYDAIAQERSFFGLTDPFGDFDLLFGAARLSRKIIDLPIAYKRRIYGQTNIRRFYHGLILIRMSLYALSVFKLR